MTTAHLADSMTILAPTDEAFRNAPKDLVARVLNDNKLVESECNVRILIHKSYICIHCVINSLNSSRIIEVPHFG